ncbi:MAG TPA: DNA gyrase subunit A [Candidatus Fermentibacter daniensis]|jgi:DNA gyrase subunit A|nr:DNA gyrase subunit A [Candidatus Fermentibacter sp.]NLI02673.1 DNA gyrase subunit A [Candidatus Fermentibacter daniensis]OQC69973.1 MAG: DNA gyrase subunit A [candidate division Hyd24-12 bacterium ADurb.Bin004]MCC6871835.1 DNA gyrase subunit A [Candidatus Fermentibacter sp.]HOA05025.1 DNA gyrase subunit A [Candidatus Fermentibacter daniensis]
MSEKLETTGTPAQPPAPGGRVLMIDLEDEMKRSYLEYAMSVIVSRALPDVRDGLKPVHRRILYSMYEQRLTHQRAFKKSATVVGDVLGKYHPHGDSAVYDALVRMAQDFSLRHPLVEGQGNFGSVDGDPAAAYRYTEARMSRIGEEMLRDIDKETVEFAPNFDQRLSEPVVLPSGVPNLLLNGSAGIAVGMATNIPPHNLRELVDACRLILQNPDTSDDDLLKVVRGPDFPTGGIIMGRSGIRNAYTTGHGSITVRGRASIEKSERGRDAIIITEIPYQVNKSTLISRMADLVKQRKLVEISDIRDESDRDGMRIVVELKREAVGEIVLNQLYRHTDLEVSFGANMLALVDNRPRRLTLKEMLSLFLDHRHEVILRRCLFEKARAEERAHILEGLRRALDVIDQIISIIRSSADQNEARAALIKGFEFSEKQAQAILDMRLHRLTSLERVELDEEYAVLIAEIARLDSIIGDRRQLGIEVMNELESAAAAYGEPRRTTFESSESSDMEMEDLIPDDSMVIMMSRAGYIKRLPLDTWKSQRRGGKGLSGAATREEDSLDQIFISTNHSGILFFTALGFCHWLKVYRIPEEGRHSKGKALVNLIDLQEGDRPVATLCVRDFSQGGNVILATTDGTLKKTPLSEYSRPRRKGIRAIRLAEGSSLLSAALTPGDAEILLATRLGQANRFSESEIRKTGRFTSGVRGVRLSEGDELVSMVILDGDGDILTVTSNGYGKRTRVSEYPRHHRGGRGVRNIAGLERNGPVVAVRQVASEDDLILVSSQAMVIRLSVADVRLCGRSTKGVRLMVLPSGDRIVDAATVEPEAEEALEGHNAGDGTAEESDSSSPS